MINSMYRSIFSLVALSASAYAQTPIGDLLMNTADLSNLTNVFTTYAPDLLTTLAGASNVTVLAPNNAAFAALGPLPQVPNINQLVSGILSYHVIKGSFSAAEIGGDPKFLATLLEDPTYSNVTGGQVVETQSASNGSVSFLSGGFAVSNVVQADIAAANDVTVHVIDKVLTVPPPIVNATVAANLTSLAGALTTANLVDTLAALPDITVFAPTNEAFGAIGSALPNLSTQALATILEYHVVNSSVLYSAKLSDGAQVPTLAGPSVTVTIQGSNIFVNGALVTIPDVLVGSGVVHVIDQVLNPNNTAGPSSSATAGTPAFPGASSVSSAPFTSGVPTPTAPVSAPAGATPSSGSGASGSSAAPGASASTASEAAAPRVTGAIGAAALLGAAGALVVGY